MSDTGAINSVMMTGAGTGTLMPSGDDPLFVCDFFQASAKSDLGTMEHPIFSLSTRPDRRVLSYEHNGAQIQVTPSVKGRATVYDKDILIYCISQLMAAMNAGQTISRKIRLRAHDLLVATGRDTGGDSYTRLRESFERLAGTRITTNITTGDMETTTGFGLIESWEILRKSRGGRMVSVVITLSEWLFRAIENKSVLTLSRDYFQLRKPLERRVYELARKHCGRQREWRIGLATLHKKTGSTAPIRVFRAAVRRMIEADPLPDYSFSEEPGDILRFAPRSLTEAAADLERAPLFGPEVIDEVRSLAPGFDAYALEAEWRAWWAETGRPHLRAPDRAYLSWVRQRVKQDT